MPRPAPNHRRALLAVAVAGLPRSAAALDRVTYLLPAPIFLPAFGPWVVARQRGHYAAEGLEIDFETAKGGADVAKQIGVGNAVVGGAMGDTPIIVRGNGVPVKSVAVLGGQGLMQLVVHADSDIKGPADLRGKTVNVTAYQETTYYATLGMLAAVGLTKSDVNIQAAGSAASSTCHPRSPLLAARTWANMTPPRQPRSRSLACSPARRQNSEFASTRSARDRR
jgi:NitT/TauT family transport system substrate-binding protein